MLGVHVERAVTAGLACLALAALAPGCGGDGPAAEGTWQTPVEISAPADDTGGRQVAVDARGNAVAVWKTSVDANTVVQAAQRPAGGRWSKPVRLSAAGGSTHAYAPQIAVDRRGNAVAVWQRSSASSARHRRAEPRAVRRPMSFVESTARSAGGSWQPPTRVSRAGSGMSEPHVGIDGQGNAVAVWQRSDAGATAVQSAVRPAAGGRWDAPVDIARLSAASEAAALPRVAVNARGDAAAVWTNVTVGNMGVVEGAIRRAGGPWQTAAALSPSGRRSFAADVAIGSQGAATAVWLDYTNSRVQAAVRPARDERWQAPQDISARGEDAGGADVAVDARGNTTVVWSAFDTVRSFATSADRPAGEDWQRPAKIAEDSEISDVHVGFDARGGAVAAWLAAEGQSAHGAARPAGGRWQEPVLISPHTAAAGATGAQLALAVAPNGRAVAVFGRQRDAAYVALAAVYGPR